MVIATIVFRLVIIYLIKEDHTIPTRNIERISHLISTAALFIFMMLFDNVNIINLFILNHNNTDLQFYKYVAKKLTDFERPRTQAQYDQSFIIKLHVLSILNAYAYLYYTAFFKGSFKTYPGDMAQYQSIGILNNDVDEAMASMLPLTFQLVFILTAKTVLKMLYEFLMPYVYLRFVITLTIIYIIF